MNILSLFDGISCGHVALERAGIKVDKYFASEIDKYAISVTQKNFPNTVQLGDVNGFENWQLPEIDLLIGGSPCQDLSIAKKGRKGLDGERSGLFWRYVDCLKKFKPKFFLLENVASMPKEAKQLITETLGVEPILINSALVSAQQRKRLYWTNIPGITQPEDKGILLRDVLEFPRKDLRPISSWVYGKFFSKRKLDCLKSFDSEKSNPVTTKKGHSLNYICNLEKTMYSNYTISEYEKLQTLSAGYTDCGIPQAERYKCVGNGWTVDVIAHIFSFLPSEFKEKKL